VGGGICGLLAIGIENLVKVGDWVEQGQVIGTVGSTARSSAPQLYIQIRLDGRKYNPALWLPELEALAAPAWDHRSPAATP
jgi:murein DD-endopeptidase MepM/ murein hydrolase activator NlpD